MIDQDEDSRDALKQLYALYLADNQIVNQKTGIFVSTTALFGAAFSVAGQHWLLRLALCVFALLFTWYWHDATSWVDKYRAFYRTSIETMVEKLKLAKLLPEFD